jgi:hypothetical protein
MRHPGDKKVRETLNQRHHHPKLWYQIDKLKCKDCHKYKSAGHGYGLLPKREVRIAPRKEVTIDLTPPTINIIFKVANLLKPWKVKVNGQQVDFNALTCIDKA